MRVAFFILTLVCGITGLFSADEGPRWNDKGKALLDRMNAAVSMCSGLECQIEATDNSFKATLQALPNEGKYKYERKDSESSHVEVCDGTFVWIPIMQPRGKKSVLKHGFANMTDLAGVARNDFYNLGKTMHLYYRQVKVETEDYNGERVSVIEASRAESGIMHLALIGATTKEAPHRILVRISDKDNFIRSVDVLSSDGTRKMSYVISQLKTGIKFPNDLFRYIPTPEENVLDMTSIPAFASTLSAGSADQRVGVGNTAASWTAEGEALLDRMTTAASQCESLECSIQFPASPDPLFAELKARPRELKYRFIQKIGDGEVQHVEICDGKYVWNPTTRKDGAKAVLRETLQEKAASSDIGRNDFYYMGEALRKNYKQIKITKEKYKGEDVSALECERAKRGFFGSDEFRVRIRISEKDGFLRTVETPNFEGQLHVALEISNLKTGIDIPNHIFTYTPASKAEVHDMSSLDGFKDVLDALIERIETKIK